MHSVFCPLKVTQLLLENEHRIREVMRHCVILSANHVFVVLQFTADVNGILTICEMKCV